MPLQNASFHDRVVTFISRLLRPMLGWSQQLLLHNHFMNECQEELWRKAK